MSVIIPDEIVRATAMTEDELKQELALMLFQSGKLPPGIASQVAGMERAKFQELLKSRNIPLYYYDIEDYELDIKNLRALGRL